MTLEADGESATAKDLFWRHLQVAHSLPTGLPMTNYREINSLAKAPDRARSLASMLLTLPEIDWSDWETDFLDSMKSQAQELSTRQAEKLVELRDESMRYTSASGFSFKTIIGACWLNRLDLDDEAAIEFIERLKETGQTALRRREALRLKRCAIALGEVEPDQPWVFSGPSFRL